jgi:predicted ribosomally synthesized peptide with nif11-like leader
MTLPAGHHCRNRKERTMSQEEIARFNQDLHASKELRERIESNRDSAESFVKAARANGYDFTEEDLADFIRQADSQSEATLDEDELDTVAGGVAPANPMVPPPQDLIDFIKGGRPGPQPPYIA